MPIVDMPLEELHRYGGTNPCPKDIDAYWDAALAEMNAIDPQVELVEADFHSPSADCYDLYFTGVKGARIHAKLLRPKNIQGKVPAVLQFHGYSGSSGSWNDKLAYAASGFVIAALDCRGQAGLSEDVGGTIGNTLNGHIIRGLRGDKNNFLMRNIFLDTAQLAKIVMEMPEVDETRVGAFGGSQGGGLTLACAALEPRICKAAPAYPFLSDYKRVWEMDLSVDAYAELRRFFRDFDPRHLEEDKIFERLGYIDIQNIAKRIRAEVLMGTGLMDTICPPSTQYAAFNKITSPKREMIYPDFGHEDLPGFWDTVYEFMMEMRTR